MKRRNFLKFSSLAITSHLFPLLNSSSGLADETKPTVWESSGGAEENIKNIFSEIGGLKTLVSKELSQVTVLVKPNICLPSPAGMGTTTSPDVVDALCNYLTDLGVKRIIITDHTLKKTTDFDKIELKSVIAKYPKAKLMFANEQRHFQPTEVDGKVLKKTEVLKMLSRMDLLINLATAKHHSATQVSLAIKNLMGLIWNRTEFHTKLDLQQAVADLALLIKPQLSIIDASRVLLNGGPTGPGPVIKENKLFASTDILALDAVVASRYNFGGKSISPQEVVHLVAAHQNGVGEISLEKIKIKKLG